MSIDEFTYSTKRTDMKFYSCVAGIETLESFNVIVFAGFNMSVIDISAHDVKCIMTYPPDEDIVDSEIEDDDVEKLIDQLQGSDRLTPSMILSAKCKNSRMRLILLIPESSGRRGAHHCVATGAV